MCDRRADQQGDSGTFESQSRTESPLEENLPSTSATFSLPHTPADDITASISQAPSHEPPTDEMPQPVTADKPVEGNGQSESLEGELPVESRVDHLTSTDVQLSNRSSADDEPLDLTRKQFPTTKEILSTRASSSGFLPLAGQSSTQDSQFQHTPIPGTQKVQISTKFQKPLSELLPINVPSQYHELSPAHEPPLGPPTKNGPSSGIAKNHGLPLGPPPSQVPTAHGPPTVIPTAQRLPPVLLHSDGPPPVQRPLPLPPLFHPSCTIHQLSKVPKQELLSCGRE